MIRRINLFGAAGCGKSTIAGGIFYHLKKSGHNIELVPEVIKQWAYEQKKPKSFDQHYIFSQQLHSEDQLLANCVQYVVTDSPIPLQIFYARKYEFASWQHMWQIAKDYEAKYQSINIFLDRQGVAYNPLGRYETEEQALNNDRELKDFLKMLEIDYVTLPTVNLNQIISNIENQINASRSCSV